MTQPPKQALPAVKSKEQPSIWGVLTEGKLSKTQMIKTFANLSPAKIVELGFPSISALSRSESPARIERALSVLLVDFNGSMDNTLKTHQLEEIVAEVSSNWMLRSLTLEDVYYVLRQIKTTHSNASLKMNQVLKALNDHNELRMQEAAKMNQNRNLSNEFNTDRMSLLSEAQKKILRKEGHQYREVLERGKTKR